MRIYSIRRRRTVGRTPWTGNQPVIRPLHNTDIHALSGIRTHDPSVRAGEDILCLIPRGPYDRQYHITKN
jgi:hypothetical protein